MVNGTLVPIKEIVGVKGAFPRWLGIGNISRNISLEFND